MKKWVTCFQAMHHFKTAICQCLPALEWCCSAPAAVRKRIMHWKVLRTACPRTELLSLVRARIVNFVLYDQKMVIRRPAIGQQYQLIAMRKTDLHSRILNLAGLQPWTQIWLSGWRPLAPSACLAAAWHQSLGPVGSFHCIIGAASLAGHQLCLHELPRFSG